MYVTMSRERLYLDIDDTYKNTESYWRRVLKSQGVKVPLQKSSIYSLLLLDGDNIYRDIFEEVTSDYSVIPERAGAKDGLKLLRTEYEVILFSSCYSLKQREAKLRLAESLGLDCILVDTGVNYEDKANILMSEGILVDDRKKVLELANVNKKVQLYNKYQFHDEGLAEGCTFVKDWFELTDLLMGVSSDDKLREYICEGVQKLYPHDIRVQECI